MDLADPPKNVTEVPDKMAVAGNSAEHVSVALGLVLVMVGVGYAFVQSLADGEPTLLVVFALVFLGCGAVLYVTARNLRGWLRSRTPQAR
ncbi:MAG: hypothetical protein J0I06_09670 [Planctomycetes bacterium]|nr:hypothetical protein [Planctomycetota bacterium]